MPLPASRTVPLIVAAALFMENLDATVIATSLPAMARDLDLSPVRLNLAITSYMVAMAVFIPASGWLADRVGARRVFVGAIALFLTGSVVCGSAPSLGILVAGRLLQGLGGAMMVPVGRLILLRSVPKAEMISAMAWFTMPALLGPLMGPPLGGFITTATTWRWIFWINVPIGLAGMTLALTLLPPIAERERTPFDGLGFLTSATGLAFLVFAFETAGRDVVSPLVGVAAAAAGIGLIVVYVRHAHDVARPLIDLELLAIPTFRVAVIGGSLFRIGVGALPFLLPLQLQVGFGRSALESGLTTFVAAAGALLMKATAGRILRAFGFRRTLLINAVAASVLLGAVGAIGASTPMVVVMTLLLAGGFLRSLEFTAINVIAFADIDAEAMSRATALSSMVQQLSLSSGVALGAMTLHLLSPDGALPSSGDFSIALAIAGAISALAFLSFRRLGAEAGEALLGRPTPATDTDAA
ncbi:DHA2 family efflux MFS transporter permease subunit [Siculibacillus lacustris]|uniref:DHA2 family efflux MFS transporter permease subunit n=1 Tax=Siculibacillus lacustris TaxID=1549641 RepID=A0A4Q9VJ99_9HYPH|nr:DHA2 family efflux MFS transporter permease subunit [Siculibacillus lacustris]TBW35373.1 DHA2 family efflux MFS transporter permease subunit [Siculibacillus lacustris]